MFHLQPAMFLSLFPLFAVFEGQQLVGGEEWTHSGSSDLSRFLE